LNRLKKSIEAKEFKILAKTDGSKKINIGVVKGKKANLAGGPKSSECVLYVMEGDSASQYTDELIGLIPNGHDYCGYFPLKGKPLNFRNFLVSQNTDSIIKNREFLELKKILGLKESTDYSDQKNFSTLRYGKIIVMTDADIDGKHILGLFYDLFVCLYPSLVKRNYIQIYRSPIVRIGRDIRFYNQLDYEDYIKKNPSVKNIKYFKGLGTSTNLDIKDDFKCQKLVTIQFDASAGEKLELAFDKRLADERKTWMADYTSTTRTETLGIIPISTFIDQEFILYCLANIQRSIPSIMDGLKTVQRKVLYTAQKTLGSKKSKCQYL
jgi:DNA topoisomerase-2